MSQKQRFKLNAAARLIASAKRESASYGADAIEDAVRDTSNEQGTDDMDVTEESADASPSLTNIQNPVPNGMM